MRGSVVHVSLVVLAFAGAGCKTCDLVEAELRAQTAKLDEAETQVLLKDAEIETLRATVNSMRGELKERGSTAPPETIYRSIGLSRVSVGQMTGGRDFDRDGKDDALQVVIVPHDYDNDVFKCPGTAAIDVFEEGASGVKRNIGHWDIDQPQLKSGWRSTVLGQGYQVVLPWQTMPDRPKLRVVVHFQTLDGREFQAERDLTVSLTKKAGKSAPDLLQPMTDDPAPEKHAFQKTSAWSRSDQTPRQDSARSQPPGRFRLPPGLPVMGASGGEDFSRSEGYIPPPRRSRPSRTPARLLAPVPLESPGS